MKPYKKNITESIAIYRDQLAQGDIQAAYVALIKYVAELKSKFSSHYNTGNISVGYLDYTYFPFTNEYLKRHKLRFGIVLNHKKMCFELWLMGQNIGVQKKYWQILKDTQWNEGVITMPQYAILKVCLEDQIDFNARENMTHAILSRSVSLATEIQKFLEQIKEE